MIFEISKREASMLCLTILYPDSILKCLKNNGLLMKLNPSSSVLLEKLRVVNLVKKFHSFYGTQRFINTTLTSPHSIHTH
jgi:hypothetical protein